MGSCPEESKNRPDEELIRELIKGEDFAKQLQILLQSPLEDNGSELAGEFLAEILRSFEQGLFLVAGMSSDQVISSEGRRQVSTFSSVNGGDGSEDSSVTHKRHALKERRGCYKRRRSTQTRTTVTPTMEDGQSWRKYGQKAIQNAKFPRSYFRCTHKYDRECKAQKQVQEMEDGSGMFLSTYIGSHTCHRDPVEPPQLIIPEDYTHPEISNNLIVFTEHVKEESRDQVDTKSDLTDNISFCSLQDQSSFLSADHGLNIGFEMSPHCHQEVDQEDVSKMYRLEEDGAQSEMELLAGSMGFHGDLGFL